MHFKIYTFTTSKTSLYEPHPRFPKQCNLRQCTTPSDTELSSYKIANALQRLYLTIISTTSHYYQIFSLVYCDWAQEDSE